MPSRFEYERAVRASDLAPLSRLLALTIATWADVRTGVIPERLMPSLTGLEKATGMARGSVRTHLDNLEAGGWLDRNRPSVAAARAEKARTRYRIKVPKGVVVPDADGIEQEQELNGARAGDALVDSGLGQELPQARAGAALELGQELTPSRAGAALSSSYGPRKSVEVPPSAVAKPLPDRMTDAFLDRFARGNAYGRRQVRTVISDTLSNGTDPDELWKALERLGDTSRPVSPGTLQFAFADIRKTSNVTPLRTSTTDERVAAGLALAEKYRAEEERAALEAAPPTPQESA
jgi:hypothetical protein